LSNHKVIEMGPMMKGIFEIIKEGICNVDDEPLKMVFIIF
jgi:hypothetical protein